VLWLEVDSIHQRPSPEPRRMLRGFLSGLRRVARAMSSLTSAEGVVVVDGVVAPTPAKAITKADVLAAQDAWATAITSISKTYLESGDYVATAGYCAGELYGYGHCNVLFKPTKAAEFPFRPTGGEAMSYFVGGGAVDGGYSEDAGFAINGGRGWKKVVFANHQIALDGDTATAMGAYTFTDATSGDEVKVEYTFGYRKNADGKMRIFLHHSSVPFAASRSTAAGAGRRSSSPTTRSTSTVRSR